MGNPITMTLSEIDSAIARNLMKWRRMTRSAVQSDVGLDPNHVDYAQSLDPHWFDREGHVVATAESPDSYEGSSNVWSPTKNAVDAQTVRSKLAEKYQSVILARIAVGAMAIFALFINNSFNHGRTQSHIAMGASEEIATSLCALAAVGIEAQIEDEAD